MRKKRRGGENLSLRGKMPNSLLISFSCSEYTVNILKTTTQTQCTPKEEAIQMSGRGSRWRVTPRLMCVEGGTAHGVRVCSERPFNHCGIAKV